MTFYVYTIEYKNKVKHCLWYENILGDRFVTEGGNVKTFNTLDQINKYGESKNFDICNENVILKIKEDFDSLSFENILDVWNTATDISNSIYSSIWIDSKTRNISKTYSKLLWGCNLEPLTPVGIKFTPYFSAEEKKLLKRIYKFAQKYVTTALLL